MEGRIAAQMERSNNISEGLQSRYGISQGFHGGAARRKSGNRASTRTIWQTKVGHIYDRVDLIYEKEN